MNFHLEIFFKVFFNPKISFHFQQGEALLETQFENIFTRTNKGQSLMKTHEKKILLFLIMFVDEQRQEILLPQ